jgi:tetratricopeptide (TPR) repeat protein
MSNGQGEQMPGLQDPITDAADPQAALAAELIKYASEANALLAELIQVAAVPRKFDDSLLRLLVGRPPSDKEFSSAFSTLIDTPFVLRRRDGRYRIHAEIRRAMLTQFAATDAGLETLAGLNRQLADYYQDEHEQARTVSYQFDLVDALLRQVSADRVPAMRSAVENQLVMPLIEAQHHRTVIDPAGTGLDHFRRSFELYESERQFEVCRLLLRSWWNDIEDLTDDTVNVLYDWYLHYQIHLALAQKDGSRAREIADELLAKPDVEPRIRLMTQGLVTRSLITECRFAEALQEIEKEIALRADNDPDPTNRWLVFALQAGIHRSLFDGDAEQASLGLALEAARSAQNRVGEAAMLSELSAVQARQGNLAEAGAQAIQALHIARTLPVPAAAKVAQQITVQMVRSFGASEPRLADLFHTEATYLSRGGDIRAFVTVEGVYVIALTNTAQFGRAHQVLDQVEARFGDQNTAERSTVLMYRANLLNAEGRAREAVDLNRRNVDEAERQRGTKWSVAAALTNAATAQMRIGDLLDDACTCADRARGLWLEMGNARGVARVDVVRAEVSRRRGNYAGARATLGDGPPLQAKGLEENWYWTAANTAAAIESLDEAVGHMYALLEILNRGGQLREAAQAKARLVQILMYAGRQEEAAEVAAGLSQLMDRLTALGKYRVNDASQQADEHDGRAVRQLSVVSNRPREAARSAVEHLQDAQSADPGPFWYAFNQAYAYLRLGDRESAGRTIRLAAEKAAGTVFAEPIASLASTTEFSLQ